MKPKMKPLMLLIFLVAALTTAPMPAALAGDPGTGELTLIIEGFENSNGAARVALVNSKENFSQATPFKAHIFPIVNGRVTETLVLPCGEYAVKVFTMKTVTVSWIKGFSASRPKPMDFPMTPGAPWGLPNMKKRSFNWIPPEKNSSSMSNNPNEKRRLP